MTSSLSRSAYNQTMFSWECVESVWCCRPHHYFHPLLLCCCIPLLRYQGRGLRPTYSGRGTISLHSPQGVLCFLFSHDCLYNSPLCQKSSIKVTRISIFHECTFFSRIYTTKKINDLFLTNTNVQKMNVKKNHPNGSISDPVPNFAFTQPSKKGKNNK